MISLLPSSVFPEAVHYLSVNEVLQLKFESHKSQEIQS